jgi:hypothetical protein
MEYIFKSLIPLGLPFHLPADRQREKASSFEGGLRRMTIRITLLNQEIVELPPNFHTALTQF